MEKQSEFLESRNNQVNLSANELRQAIVQASKRGREAVRMANLRRTLV